MMFLTVSLAKSSKNNNTMEPSIFKKLCDLFIGLSFWEQVLFACLVFIILLIVPCCIISWIRTKSLSSAFAWTSVPAFRASQLYWRQRVVRDGEKSYDKFLKKYSKIHIKDYDIEKREEQREHAYKLHWNKLFRKLVCKNTIGWLLAKCGLYEEYQTYLEVLATFSDLP